MSVAAVHREVPNCDCTLCRGNGVHLYFFSPQKSLVDSHCAELLLVNGGLQNVFHPSVSGYCDVRVGWGAVLTNLVVGS